MCAAKLNGREIVAEIKLYVCCHRPDQRVPNHPLLVPVQVGAALAKRRFEGYLQDDSGENISEKNHSYCELTALYWAWKNSSSDFIGLFHYRRYLYPDLDAKRPYIVKREPTLQCLERMGYSRIAEIIENYDVILPRRENMHVTVRQHYATAPFHHEKDLTLAEEIIRTKFPDDVPAMERYLSGTELYFGNIMIMRSPVLDDYCRWLFSILEEFDRRGDFTGYGTQELRVDGYLAERLLGVYLKANEEKLRVLELPGVHFFDGRDYIRHKLLNALLPPGTKIRAAVKRHAGLRK